MTDQFEWGPWIKHDGNGCPCVGQMVQCVDKLGRLHECVAGSFGVASRSWDSRFAHQFYQVFRYRVRRPRALQQLRDIAALKSQPQEVTV